MKNYTNKRLHYINPIEQARSLVGCFGPYTRPSGNNLDYNKTCHFNNAKSCADIAIAILIQQSEGDDKQYWIEAHNSLRDYKLED